MRTTDSAHCADCDRAPHDGVVLRELLLFTDPVDIPRKYLCADGPTGDRYTQITRVRRRRLTV